MNAVELSFGQVFDILSEANGIREDKRTAFRSRLQAIQKMGWPAGTNTGRGVKATYHAVHLFQMEFIVQLLHTGLTPERVVSLMKVNWPQIMLTLCQAWDDRSAKRELARYMTVRPTALIDLQNPDEKIDGVLMVPTTNEELSKDYSSVSGGGEDDRRLIINLSQMLDRVGLIVAAREEKLGDMRLADMHAEVEAVWRPALRDRHGANCGV